MTAGDSDPHEARFFTMACESQADGAEKQSPLSYCGTHADDSSLHWVKEFHNGQVLMVLTASNTCSSTFFDMELCAEKLKTFGIQMTMDQWRNLIQNAILEPEVRRYMFYNSRAFGIAIAVIFYISVWANIYSTMQLYSFGCHWEVSILVTLAAIALTIVVILIIDQHQRKIHVNTDVRLAAANEVFMKHNLLLGVADAMDRHQNILQSALRHNLDQFCVTMETVIHSGQGRGEESSSEESPLLPSDKKRTLACSELLHLIPEGAPEVMAQQLLVIFSGYYIRLLISGQLPQVIMLRHVEHMNIPCLCQFIEMNVLDTGHCWFRTR
ncbi:transmembrane protein 268 isoform X3 [Malaclemys terrapin pileata]|uniref:transmembrane protein 268 isoform X3 n=1 Tax=Malaclemys terrapin pileata TaxID=2991368 RepID=UPI0023A7DDB3|nr:transmembrane protein 268 isoform X3 [Malaclemys terrapin pileata]